jgi:hypothetical protein
VLALHCCYRDSTPLGVKQGFTWRENGTKRTNAFVLAKIAGSFGGASVMPSTNESAKFVNKEMFIFVLRRIKRCVTLLQGKRDHFYSLGDVTDFSVKSWSYTKAELLRCFCGGFFECVFVFLKACPNSITLMYSGQWFVAIFMCMIYNNLLQQ